MPFLILLLLIGSCHTSRSASDMKHDLGRTVNEANPWQWQKLSYDELRTLLFAKETLLPLQHPLSQSLQQLADRIEDHVRSLEPEKSAIVPKVRVAIRRDAGDNASAELVRSCLKIPLRFAGGGEQLIDRATFAREIPEISGYAASDVKPPCKYLSLNAAALTSLFAWLLEAFPTCSSHYTGSELILEEACRDYLFAGFKTIGGAKEISFYQVSDWITVDLGAFATENEAEMSGLLAHELAHLFFAHAVARSDLYSLYYRLGQNPPRTKPKADPELQDLGAQISQLSRTLTADAFPSVGKRPQAGLVFGVWKRFFPLLITRCGDACPSSCKKLGTEVFSASDIFGTFPFEELPEAAKSAWTRFDTLSSQCAEDFPASKSRGLSRELRRAAGELSPLTLDISLPDDQPLSASLRLLEEQHALLYQKAQADYKRLIKTSETERLAQYTIEQEADEAGLEWAAALGISPEIYLEQRVRWLKSLPSKSATNPFGVSRRRCLQFLANAWRDEAGDPIYIQPGDFTDAHHQPCYRVFTIAREIKAHAYRPARTWKPTLANWDSLVRDAAAELEKTNRP